MKGDVLLAVFIGSACGWLVGIMIIALYFFFWG